MVNGCPRAIFRSWGQRVMSSEGLFAGLSVGPWRYGRSRRSGRDGKYCLRLYPTLGGAEGELEGAEYDGMVILMSRKLVKVWMKEDKLHSQSMWLDQQVKVSVGRTGRVRFAFHTAGHALLSS